MAILLGATAAGGMIATGLYLALRPRDEAPCPPSGPAVDAPLRGSSALRPEGPAQATAVQPVTQAPASPPASREDVARAAAAALAELRAGLAKKCAAGVVPADASRQKYMFNFTFDAQGRQITRGALGTGENNRPEVMRCVLDSLPPLVLQPIGAVTYVEVPFSLP